MRLERRHRLNLNEDWLRRTVHITVPNGESSRRPVRRVSITYALRIISVPKTTPAPAVIATTEATKDDVVRLEPLTTEQPDDETTENLPDSEAFAVTEIQDIVTDSSVGTKFNLISETEEEDEDVEYISTTSIPIEAEVTESYNISEDVRITNLSQLDSSNEMAVTTNSPEVMTTEADDNTEMTNTPEIIINSDDASANTNDETDIKETIADDSMISNSTDPIMNNEDTSDVENIVENMTETDTFNISDVAPTTEYVQITTFENNENYNKDSEVAIKKTEEPSMSQEDNKKENMDMNESHTQKTNTEVNNSQTTTNSPPILGANTNPPEVKNNSSPQIDKKSIVGTPKHIGKDSIITYIHGLKLKRNEDLNIFSLD